MRSLNRIIKKNAYNIPYSAVTAPLITPYNFNNNVLLNRFALLISEGGDAEDGGEFGIYTHRRYARYAGEGASVIFFESTAVSQQQRKDNHQLCICQSTVDCFSEKTDFVRNISQKHNNISPMLILNLYPGNDDFLKNPEHYLEACVLAQKAGFDGVEMEISCDYADEVILFFSELKKITSGKFILAININKDKKISNYTRVLSEICNRFENVILMCDLSCNSKKPEEAEKNFIFLSDLKELNLSFSLLTYGYCGFEGEGFNVASGSVLSGISDMVGFSRQAAAYPNFIKDITNKGIKKNKCCKMCGKCDELRSAGLISGCVTYDVETYLPYYHKLIK